MSIDNTLSGDIENRILLFFLEHIESLISSGIFSGIFIKNIYIQQRVQQQPCSLPQCLLQSM